MDKRLYTECCHTRPYSVKDMLCHDSNTYVIVYINTGFIIIIKYTYIHLHTHTNTHNNWLIVTWNRYDNICIIDMSSRFSCISQTFAWEIQDNLGDMFSWLLTHNIMQKCTFADHRYVDRPLSGCTCIGVMFVLTHMRFYTSAPFSVWK